MVSGTLQNEKIIMQSKSRVTSKEQNSTEEIFFADGVNNGSYNEEPLLGSAESIHGQITERHTDVVEA